MVVQYQYTSCFSFLFFPCLPCPFVFFLFSPFFFSFFFFCIYYEFILAEDLCVHFPLLLISLSFSGGFLLTEVFPFLIFLNLCTGCQGVKIYFSESFGRSGYIPCRTGKDGGFIRRDRSFHLPRISLAKAGRCVTDTLSKKFMSVWVTTG